MLPRGSGKPMPSLRLIDLKGKLPETGESVSLFNYLPEEAIVVLWAPLEIAEQAKSYFDRLPEVKGSAWVPKGTRDAVTRRDSRSG